MINRIVNLLFPPKCIFCLNIINFDCRIRVCEDCIRNLKYKNNDKPMDAYVSNYYFDRIICIYNYSGLVRDAIRRFKFHDRPDYGKTFAEIIQNSTKYMTRFDEFDIILSVPLYKERLKNRGYNQSYIISKRLAEISNTLDMSAILIRSVPTRNQSELSRKERLVNVLDAFSVKDGKCLKDKKVLLVDDIFTTGSTLNECSKVLKLSGASMITILVLASGIDINDWNT